MPNGRLGSKKVKTGCRTCRIRGVKCDERKPFCHKCLSTGRKCDGYLYVPQTARTEDWSPPNHNHHPAIPSPERALSDFVASSREKRIIGFFRDQVAPALSGSLDTSFWSGLVLRLTHNEASVRYAVMAVAALFERFQSNESILSDPRLSSGDDQRQFAIQCYNKAINATRRRIDEENSIGEVPLLTCILFVCIEFLQGNEIGALSLCNQGSTMLRTLPESSSDSPSESNASMSSRSAAIREHYKPLFDRMKVLSALFGQPQEDGPLRSSSRSISLSAPNTAASIQTLAEARVLLYALMEQSHKLLRTASSLKYSEDLDLSAIGALEAERDTFLRAIHSWREEFSQLETKYDPRSQEANASTVLQMYCSSTFMLIATALDVSESAHDGYLAEYQSLVYRATTLLGQCSSPSGGSFRMANFTFEMGIIPPLYLTAIKCRHPGLRREALSLLRRSRRRESLWDAAESAAVAERVISLEEEGIASDDGREDDPSCWPEEERRVHSADYGSRRLASSQDEHIVVDVKFRSRTRDGIWQITEELVCV